MGWTIIRTPPCYSKLCSHMMTFAFIWPISFWCKHTWIRIELCWIHTGTAVWTCLPISCVARWSPWQLPGSSVFWKNVMAYGGCPVTGLIPVLGWLCRPWWFWIWGVCVCVYRRLVYFSVVNVLQVISYLFAQKLQVPSKFQLIRGNHEIRSVQENFTYKR